MYYVYVFSLHDSNPFIPSAISEKKNLGWGVVFWEFKKETEINGF